MAIGRNGIGMAILAEMASASTVLLIYRGK